MAPSPELTLRPAEAQDCVALCRLYADFHEFHARGVPDRLRSLGAPEVFDCTELSARLGDILRDPDAVIIVAILAGEVVGLAEAYLRRDEEHPARVARCYGHLQSLMVVERARCGGIGARLVAAVERWARERGAAETRLDTWEFDAGPLPFYERLGFHTLRRTLVKSIQPGRDDANR